ncbi:MAG TPA: hypothetical protein VK590_05030 [Saprospiraceae bacterium]|nr:hypothetical protein [Saprospiraceae bacterium]
MVQKNIVDKESIFKWFIGICIPVIIWLQTWILSEVIYQGKINERQETSIVYINKNISDEYQKNTDQDRQIVEIRNYCLRPEDISIRKKNRD